MERDLFDLYKTVLADTHQVAKRRENLESGYITLMTFALAGDGYLAATSQFDNWLPIILSVGIGLFALAATARYSRALRTVVLTEEASRKPLGSSPSGEAGVPGS